MEKLGININEATIYRDKQLPPLSILALVIYVLAVSMPPENFPRYQQFKGLLPFLGRIIRGGNGTLVDDITKNTSPQYEREIIEVAPDFQANKRALFLGFHFKEEKQEHIPGKAMYGGLVQPVITADVLYRLTNRRITPIMEGYKGVWQFLVSKFSYEFLKKYEEELKKITENLINPVLDPIMQPVHINFGQSVGAILTSTDEFRRSIKYAAKAEDSLLLFLSAEEEDELHFGKHELKVYLDWARKKGIPIHPAVTYPDPKNKAIITKIGPEIKWDEESLEDFRKECPVNLTLAYSLALDHPSVDTLTGKVDLSMLTDEERMKILAAQLEVNFAQFQVAKQLPERFRGVYGGTLPTMPENKGMSSLEKIIDNSITVFKRKTLKKAQLKTL